MGNRRNLFVAALFLGMVGGGAAGQKNKSWTEWSQKDAEKILTESAWSHVQSETDRTKPNALSPRMNEMQVLGQFDRTHFRIRFLSARPIRQALYRMAQLNPKNSSPNLLKKLEAFIDADFSEAIVIGVEYYSQEPRLIGPAVRIFGNAVTSTLKDQTYLDAGGKRAFLQDYRPPAPNGIGGAWFIFPRDLEGKPLVDDKSDELRFHAEFPVLDANSSQLILDWRFKISSFLYNGVLEF